MKAIIMAGGQGVRLRPLTCSVPKPLSLLCGRPVVYYILDLLDKHGFTQAVFTTGYKSEQLEKLFETGRYKNIELRFSREDFPLGTAGCVKRAIKNAGNVIGKSEDFLIISGDALCDFDLSASLEYHKKVSAKATVITKRVDDPREYGLVLSENSKAENSENTQNGLITGFSEKPSYLGCMGDCANTGVYWLSSDLTELIPDDAACDFARDVFPQMLQKEMPLYCYEEKGYWCDIGDFSTYARSQLDILSGKVKCAVEGRKIAEGVYSKSALPDNVTIKSPCYIGENVTFNANNNNGEIILSNSVICDNVNIGSNVKVQGSVILNSTFISDGVTANGAVICNGAKLLHSASAYEGSVIGEGCVIGREAIVSGGVKIWNEKTVPTGANVTRDIKYGSKTVTELSDGGVCGETNADITPELCARLGAALACISKSIAVSCENNSPSIAMKHALMAGAAGAGGDAFDTGTAVPPQLLYSARLLNCGVTAWIKCGIFTEIEIIGKDGLPLTRQQERLLEAGLSRSEYKNADRNGFGQITAFAGYDRLYVSMIEEICGIYKKTGFTSSYRIKLNCNNATFSESIKPVFDSVSAKKGEILIVALTANGAKAEFYTEDNMKVSYEQLVLLAAAAAMQNGNDVALPNDFAACADFLADSYGKKVYRYFLCSNDSRDSHARELAANQPFLRDGAVLALEVLRYISQSGMSIKDAVKSIPQFASARREVEINCPPQRIISRICSVEAGTGKGEGVLVGDNKESVLIRSAKRGNALFLLAESLSSETAAQLCDNAENLIKDIIRQDNNEIHKNHEFKEKT